MQAGRHARTELLGALDEARQDVRGDGLRRIPDAQRDDLGVRVGLQEGRAAARDLGEEVAAVLERWIGLGGWGLEEGIVRGVCGCG
jgi:hypothetical protein